MPKKIILKEGGLNGSNSPTGYKFLGLDNGDLGLKSGETLNIIGSTGATGPTGSLPDNFEGFLTGATAISLLEDHNNWEPGGTYSGATAIDGTFQGQLHYDSGEFLFLAVNDNEWIRWKIGGTAS